MKTMKSIDSDGQHQGFYMTTESGMPIHVLGNIDMSKETATMLSKMCDLAFDYANAKNNQSDFSGSVQNESDYITGLYGCSCHPFLSWAECDKYHKQKFEVGQSVKHRCLGKVGVITKILVPKYWVGVKYGDLPRDLETEHVAMLELLLNN